jgi:hypothetical protein
VRVKRECGIGGRMSRGGVGWYRVEEVWEIVREDKINKKKIKKTEKNRKIEKN